ncbi:MAG: hypothetical protein HYZ09_01795 [Candidatus Kerfeldbacteria bacterium]|nr:hypothetical protein [Candidatus Kerfeldbacteria bacterium]
MRASNLFAPSRKELPKDETSTNAQLLLRAGYVDKLMAGVYSLLPLGLTVQRHIERIIREEMNALGAQELLLPALHPKSLWDVTGRWATLADIMYQFRDHQDRSVGLGTTHEEVITDIVAHSVTSYRDLPLKVYQIQTKFRDEPRAKSGLIRLREFTMKDLYTFHADAADLATCYDQVQAAYRTIFERCGLKAKIIEASGGAFTKEFSHEFSVVSDAGEDRIVFCPACDVAQNKEIARVKGGQLCPNGDGTLAEAKAVEVGNIFKLGTRFSEALHAVFRDAHGREQPMHMASYGIGPGRVLATIVEVHHDEQGIVWPASVSPSLATIISLGAEPAAAALYRACEKAGVPVLYADRAGSAGEQFATADLLGFPVRIVASKKTGAKLEWKRRDEDTLELVTPAEALKRLTALERERYAR